MRRLSERLAWALAGALGIVLVLALARVISAGPLDPPGPVGSTMKTLVDLPPSWHQILAANNGADSCHSSRFTCVLTSDAGVLDNETGLVWQRSPSTVTQSWVAGTNSCAVSLIGGRRGWRMPTFAELASLNVSGVGLPAGHPFTNVSGFYWTASDSVSSRTFAIRYDPGSTNPATAAERKIVSTTTRLWCVRGPDPRTPDTTSPYVEGWFAGTLPADDGPNAFTSSRFAAVGNTSVVVDHETGLFWQADPADDTTNWAAAVSGCARFSLLSNTSLGWRLPTLDELMSLFTFGGTGILPTGHPFTGISGVYWTATTDAATSANAYTVDTTQVETSTVLAKTATTGERWCVRGYSRP
jgi:hypothetical protein